MHSGSHSVRSDFGDTCLESVALWEQLPASEATTQKRGPSLAL